MLASSVFGYIEIRSRPSQVLITIGESYAHAYSSLQIVRFSTQFRTVDLRRRVLLHLPRGVLHCPTRVAGHVKELTSESCSNDMSIKQQLLNEA